MSTIRLFDENPYLTNFTANIVRIETISSDNSTIYKIILDRTAFFPDSGGQCSDIGLLGDGKVISVQIVNEEIIHDIVFDDIPNIKVGDEIKGCIDWTHRFSNMQQHTGEHIFSGIVHKHFGYDNVGFHLSPNSVTMDYNGKLSWEDVLFVERLANKAVFNNLNVVVSYPSSDELNNIDYRSKLDAADMKNIRLVSIPDIDICACCATHVHKTGEVGIIKATDLMNYKEGVRIHILCGNRALEDYNTKQNLVKKSSNSLSAPIEKIPESIEKLKSIIDSQKLALKDAHKQILLSSIDNILPDTIHPYIFTELSDNNILRDAVNKLVARHSGFCFIFSGTDTKGYNYIVGTKDNDATSILSTFKEKLDAKGGGSPKMIQGQIPKNKDAILDILSKYIFN